MTVKVLSITCKCKIVLLAEEHSFWLFFKGYTGAKPWGSKTAAAPVNISPGLQECHWPRFLFLFHVMAEPTIKSHLVPCIGLHHQPRYTFFLLKVSFSLQSLTPFFQGTWSRPPQFIRSTFLGRKGEVCISFPSSQRSLCKLVHFFPQEPLLVLSGTATFSDYKRSCFNLPGIIGARTVYNFMNKENCSSD